MEKITVAIGVITYNQEGFIKDAIEGIITQQTNFKYKLFLIDDFSSDRTTSICEYYFNKYSEIIDFQHLEKNIGANDCGKYCLNKCLVSGADYIAICEGDDYWTDPLKLQKQVDFLEHNPDYAICFHPIKIFDQENNKLIDDHITRNVAETTAIKDLAKGNYIHTPSVVLRNDFVLPPWFSKSPIGDWVLYMLVVKEKKIKKLDDFMAVYRIHRQSIWSLKTKEHRILSTIKSIELLIQSKEIAHDIKVVLSQNILGLKSKLPKKPNMVSVFINKIKSIINA